VVNSFAVVFVAAACAAPAEVIAARERGRRDAERDIAAGLPRVAFLGTMTDSDDALDPATGRLRFSSACCRGAREEAYRDAYNDAVETALDAGRLAPFAGRAMTRASVDALLDGPSAQRIALGEPGAATPDGRARIVVAPGTGRASLALWLFAEGSADRMELRYLASPEVRIAFSGDGATLCLRDERARASATFDVARAAFLEVFPDQRDAGRRP
jgi:hypothetical protein